MKYKVDIQVSLTDLLPTFQRLEDSLNANVKSFGQDLDAVVVITIPSILTLPKEPTDKEREEITEIIENNFKSTFRHAKVVRFEKQ